MDLLDSDFKNLTFKIHQHSKDTEILRLYPIFSRYDAFLCDPGWNLNINWIIRYIIYCFDLHSPLLSIDDMFERRIRSAELAGFIPLSEGKFSQPVNAFLLSQNRIINSMIIQYCVMVAGEEYATFITYQDALQSNLDKLMNLSLNKDDDEKETQSTIISNIDKLRASIKKIRDEIFVFKDDRWLESDLYAFTQMRRLRITPEDYAVLLEENEVILDPRTFESPPEEEE